MVFSAFIALSSSKLGATGALSRHLDAGTKHFIRGTLSSRWLTGKGSACKPSQELVWGGQCPRSHLVADVGDRISRITTAGLTPRRPVQVPVSVLTLVTEDADHPRPAGTLSCPGVAETGTPQRAVSHLRAAPVTGAFWESNSLYHDTYEATPTV